MSTTTTADAAQLALTFGLTRQTELFIAHVMTTNKFPVYPGTQRFAAVMVELNEVKLIPPAALAHLNHGHAWNSVALPPDLKDWPARLRAKAATCRNMGVDQP